MRPRTDESSTLRGGPRAAVRAAGLLFLLALLGTGACQPGRSGSNVVAGLPRGSDYVLAPESNHYGATYAQWSQRWWQWAMEVPRTDHPLYDEAGVHALEGQIVPVYFLGGILTPPGAPTRTSVVRDITIPSGIALFFPVIAFAEDNVTCGGPDTALRFIQLRARAAERMKGIRGLRCEIDGDVVLDAPDLGGAQRYRAQAPGFGAWIPDDNLYDDECGGGGVGARVVQPVAADGVYMMIAPMPSGGHTVQFQATGPNPGDPSVSVTYNVTVMP